MGSTTLPRDRLAVRIGLSSLLTLVIATAIGLSSGFGPATAQDVDRKAKSADKKTQPPKVKLGLILNDPKALPGYTLLSTINSKSVYLLDNEARVVHSWKPETSSSHCCYLLPNGHLLRPADLGGREKAFGGGPAPSAGSKSSHGTARSSGTSRSSMISNFPTMTSARCPTATSS